MDVALVSHDHDYECFAPMNGEGQYDSEQGMREFVVGTGGKSLDDFTGEHANSEVGDFSTYRCPPARLARPLRLGTAPPGELPTPDKHGNGRLFTILWPYGTVIADPCT